MTQLFRRRSNTIAKVSILLIFGVPTLAFIVLEFYKWSTYETEIGVAIAQPVPFSHEHHVGGLKIDCRYCHSFVENSPFAGMPTSKTCMTCHSQIWHDAKMLKPVRDSFETNHAIGWNQIYRLPKYVYFDHSIHVNKGIGCTTCHGQIDRMPLTEKAQSFYMRDCLSCHRHPENFLRKSDQIFSVSWHKTEEQLSIGQELLHKYKIRTDHLMDCNTCHR